LANLDRLNRTLILSPVKGIVKQIKITTVGGISQPGADIMEIVPLEDNLLIEAKVQPKDIGFIHLGQEAVIKVAAYDYSIYGGLKGHVESISADTLTDDKGVSYFLIRVRTKKNYLGSKSRALYIIPGMTVTMEVLTGKKTILHYLLKPIFKAEENAFRER
jgi:adhesin transport system membrane fusion protein